MTTCQRCLFTDDIAKIGTDQCEYCDLHDRLETDADDFNIQLKKIQKISGQYNCLIGISGGLDSSILLYTAVRKWKLRPLVIHFDNHWNTEIAKQNMLLLIQKLNVNSITYTVDKREYDDINRAFLTFGLPDADIPNDIAMTKLMYETATKYGIKWILNGHDFRREGSTPKSWTRIDGKYLEDVYKKYTGKDLQNYPNLTFWDQIKYGFRGIKQIRPFHCQDVDYTMLSQEMITEIGWESYGDKHHENTYTHFVGGYLLPIKFGIDKRIVYLSAQVRSGLMTREQGMANLRCEPSDFNLSRIGSFKDYISTTISDRDDFRQYNFKKWKWVVWLLYVMGVVPRTFLVKYCS